MRKSSTALFVVLLAACLTPAFAQEHSQPSSSPAATAQPGKAHAAGASDQEEAKDDSLHETEEQMKKSASVQALGKMLGIKDPTTAYWVFWTLNFLVIAGVLGAVMKSKLPAFFSGRTNAIQKGIEEARKVSAEASARLSVIETRLASLDSDITSIRDQAEREGKAEEDRLRATTEEEKRKILEAAEQEIAAATNVARKDLKNYAAELAVALAEKRIAISDAADKALVQNFANNLGNGQRGDR
jgi:F-type H+-transporting ATPase subunit b